MESYQNPVITNVAPVVPLVDPVTQTKETPPPPVEMISTPILPPVEPKKSTFKLRPIIAIAIVVMIIIFATIAYLVISPYLNSKKLTTTDQRTNTSIDSSITLDDVSITNLNDIVTVAAVGTTINPPLPDNYIKYYSQDSEYEFSFPSLWSKKDNPGNGFEFIMANIQDKVALGTIHGYKYQQNSTVQLESEKNMLSENPSLKFGNVVNTKVEGKDALVTILPFAFLENGQLKYGAVVLSESQTAGNYGLVYMANIDEFDTYFSNILISFKPTK